MTFLPRADIARITNRTRYSAQRRALDRLGFRYVVADSGEPLVRVDALDGERAPARNRGPRWEFLNRV